MPFYIRLLRPPSLSSPPTNPNPHDRFHRRPPSPPPSHSTNSSASAKKNAVKKKPPTSHNPSPPPTLELPITLTLTTDLGDAFFYPHGSAGPLPNPDLDSRTDGPGVQYLKCILYRRPASDCHGRDRVLGEMDVLYSSTFEWTEGQTALRWRGAVSGQILGRLRGGDEVWVRVFAVEERGSARWFAEGEEEEGRREVLDFLDLRTTGLPEIVGVWARVGVDWEVLGMEGKDGGERMVLRRFGMRVARRGRGSDAGMLEGGDRKGRKRQGKVDGDGGERELGQEEVLELRIWEEMGESIARHVWDAALALLAYLSSLTFPLPPLPLPASPSNQVPFPSSPPHDSTMPFKTSASSNQATHPSLSPLLRPLISCTLSSSQQPIRILELGSGCGIVGLALYHLLQHPAHVLLTDLPEAMEILNTNVTENVAYSGETTKVEAKVLNWEWDLENFAKAQREQEMDEDLLANLKSNGAENEKTKAGIRNEPTLDQASNPLKPEDLTPDLVLVSDCTYNSDSLPNLVRTLVSLTNHKCKNETQPEDRFRLGGLDVLVSLKRRHESEDVFFQLMAEAGFRVSGREEVPLGLKRGRRRDGTIAEEKGGEVVEIFGFGRMRDE